ncbi:MAG: hypothetical protein J6Y94_06505 [Bacteriovoracaceae bacterium]|nr:hypothetical protein [Bacteriovoracaceae bacterium]
MRLKCSRFTGRAAMIFCGLLLSGWESGAAQEINLYPRHSHFQKRYLNAPSLTKQSKILHNYLVEEIQNRFTQNGVAGEIKTDPKTQREYWQLTPGTSSVFNQYAAQAAAAGFEMRFDPGQTCLDPTIKASNTKAHQAKIQYVDLAQRIYYVGPNFFSFHYAHNSPETQANLAFMRLYHDPAWAYLQGAVNIAVAANQQTMAQPPSSALILANTVRREQSWIQVAHQLLYLEASLEQLAALPHDRLAQKGTRHLKNIHFIYYRLLKENAFRVLDFLTLLSAAQQKIPLMNVHFAVRSTTATTPAAWAYLHFSTGPVATHTFTFPLPQTIATFSWDDLWSWPCVQQTYHFLAATLQEVASLETEFARLQSGPALTPATLHQAAFLATQIKAIRQKVQTPPIPLAADDFKKQWIQENIAIQNMARHTLASINDVQRPKLVPYLPAPAADQISLADIETKYLKKFQQAATTAERQQISQNFMQQLQGWLAQHHIAHQPVNEDPAARDFIIINATSDHPLNKFVQQVQPYQIQVIIHGHTVLSKSYGHQNLQHNARHFYVDKFNRRLLIGLDIIQDASYLAGPEAAQTLAVLRALFHPNSPRYLAAKSTVFFSSLKMAPEGLPLGAAYPGYPDRPEFFIPRPIFNKSPYYAPLIHLVRAKSLLEIGQANLPNSSILHHRTSSRDRLRIFRKANLIIHDAWQLVAYRLLDLNLLLSALSRPEVQIEFKILPETSRLLATFTPNKNAFYEFEFPYYSPQELPMHATDLYALPALQQAYRFFVFWLQQLADLAQQFSKIDIYTKHIADIPHKQLKAQHQALAAYITNILQLHAHQKELAAVMSGPQFAQFWQKQGPTIQAQAVEIIRQHDAYWSGLDQLVGTTKHSPCQQYLR